MKRLSSFLAFTALLYVGTSCLKDKGFEDQVYGTQVNSKIGVAFPQAAASPVISSINSQTTPSVVQGPLIALEQSGEPATAVTITVTQNDALIDEVNTAQDLTLAPLPAGTFSLTPLTVVIPAGEKLSDAIKITIPNSTVLDPTVTYAMGFTISSIDNSYTIAENQKNLVVAFSIKNKYDAIYKLKIRSVGWAAYGIADGTTANYTGDFGFITAGPSSNTLYSNAREDYLLPALTNTNGFTAFGATTPLFVFDPTTNALTDVQNTTPDDGRGRVLQLNPAVTDSRYDPATKTVYAAFIMKQNGRPDQFFYDTLTYIKER